jgi:hypothetical protein
MSLGIILITREASFDGMTRTMVDALVGYAWRSNRRARAGARLLNKESTPVGETTAGVTTMTPIKHMASQYLYLVCDCRTRVLALVFVGASSSPDANRHALCGARPSVVWSAFAGRVGYQADPALGWTGRSGGKPNGTVCSRGYRPSRSSQNDALLTRGKSVLIPISRLLYSHPPVRPTMRRP